MTSKDVMSADGRTLCSNWASRYESKAPSTPATTSKQHCRMLQSRSVPSTTSNVASTLSPTM